MPIRHRLLAIVVAVLWGANFIAIHASLEVFPPFLCAALRFLLLAVPTVLLVPRPQVPTRWLVGYGIGFGILQFAFLYLAMDVGMPAGLASLEPLTAAGVTINCTLIFSPRQYRAAREAIWRGAQQRDGTQHAA